MRNWLVNLWDLSLCVITFVVVFFIAYFFGGWAAVGLQWLGEQNEIDFLRSISLGTALSIRLGSLAIFFVLWVFFVFERKLLGRQKNTQRNFWRPFIIGHFCFVAFATGLHFMEYKVVRVSARGEAMEQVEKLAASIDDFYRVCGYLPQRWSDLLAQESSCPDWRQKSLLEQIPVDPWGREMLFVHRTSSAEEVVDVEIRSLGEDGQVGGWGDSKDISSLGEL